MMKYRYIRKPSKDDGSAVVADCNDRVRHNGECDRAVGQEKKVVQRYRSTVDIVRETTKKVSDFNKELFQDAMHALQQAKELTLQTEQLEDLVRLPDVRTQRLRASQDIDHESQLRPVKRPRSDRKLDTKRQIRDIQRYNNRTNARLGAAVGPRGKRASDYLRRLSHAVADENRELFKEAVDISELARQLTRQTCDLEEIVRLPDCSQGLGSAQSKGAESEDSKRSTKRYRLGQNVIPDPNSHGRLVCSDKPRSCENKETENQSFTLFGKVRESTKQETYSSKELYHEAMKALNQAKELSRQTEELEKLVRLPSYNHRRTPVKSITIPLDTTN